MKQIARLLSIMIASMPVADNIWAQEKENVLINTGFTWEYQKSVPCKGSDENGDYSGKTFTISRYKFGETVEKFGKQYCEWKLTHVREKEMVAYSSDPEKMICREKSQESKDSVVDYLREEDSKVFLLLDKRAMHIYNPAQDSNIEYTTEEGEEAILYDFSVSEGDFYKSIYNGTILTGMTVVNVGETLVGGANMKKIYVMDDRTKHKKEIAHPEVEWPQMLSEVDFQYLGLSFVEGIGNVYPGGMTALRDYFSNFIWPYGNDPVLYRVFDAAGNEIYISDTPLGEAGIDGLEMNQYSVSPQSSKEIFDIHGRVVTNPQPGSVYIRGGKKFVAR